VVVLLLTRADEAQGTPSGYNQGMDSSAADHLEPEARLDELSTALDDLHDELATEEPIEAVLQRLVETAVVAIPGADVVSVTVVSGTKPSTVAATDQAVLDIDRDQYAAGEGPCLEAAELRRPVRVDVAGARERWPAFAAAAERAGVRSYLSAPLLLNTGTEELVGAMNIYGYEVGAFTNFDEALIRLFTTAASGAISNARRAARCRELTEQLGRALVSHAEIDQAKGALMAIHGISADEAFTRLVRQSQTTNTKLINIARELLASLRTPA
jgi:GAF domain-containing protein